VKFRLLLLPCLLALAGGLAAHDRPNAGVPSLQALKSEDPVTVDGRLDEPFWSRTPVASDLLDMRTLAQAEQRTTIRVAYSHSHILLGIECFDDRMDQIRASERREDRAFTGDDWVEVHFDPPHTHRSKYAFFSNPLGTRADANEGPSGIFNYGWTSSEWELATRVETNRWVIEMKIPFGIMNYERRDGQVWGFNLTRAVRRTDSTSFWSLSTTDTYKPRHFGHLTGLDLADTSFSRQWEVTPYVSSRTDFNDDVDTFFRAGLDTSFRLSPSITSAWTVRPDFGQVEADDDTIELRDTERFLSEKRPFFREGDELMRMTHRLYYSRRFTDIKGGVQASGLMSGLSFNALNLYGDLSHNGRAEGNSAVVRVLQPVGERSSQMYYVADTEMDQGHSRVLSADGYYFLTDAWRWSYQVSGTDDERTNPAGARVQDAFDYLADGSLIYSRYPWTFTGGYTAISDAFDPVLAYIPRRNIFGPTVSGQFLHNADARWYKQVTLYADTQYFDSEAGNRALLDHTVFGRVVFPSDLGIEAGHDQDFHAPWHNRRTKLGVDWRASDYWRSIQLDWAVGEFESTEYHELRFEKPFKLIDRLPVRYDLTVRFEDRPGGDAATVWLNRIIFDLFLTEHMWIKSSLQHRDHGLQNISVIYGWEFRPNTWWYLVYNDIDDGNDAGRSVFTKLTWRF
jgi:hypothetical protein